MVKPPSQNPPREIKALVMKKILVDISYFFSSLAQENIQRLLGSGVRKDAKYRKSSRLAAKKTYKNRNGNYKSHKNCGKKMNFGKADNFSPIKTGKNNYDDARCQFCPLIGQKRQGKKDGRWNYKLGLFQRFEEKVDSQKGKGQGNICLPSSPGEIY